MRTKALLGLAVLAASAATCMAQGNVYSLNIVGYVNVQLEANKFALIANPLTPSNGNTQITNSIVLSEAAVDAIAYKWNGTGYDQSIWYGGTDGWLPSVDLPVGDAFFIKSPVAATITFVGEVATGTVDQTLPAGTSLKANKIPVAAAWPGKDIGTEDDIMYTWGGTGWNNTWIYYGNPATAGDGWLDSNNVGPDGPTLAPGVGVAYISKAAAALSWQRTFNP